MHRGNGGFKMHARPWPSSHDRAWRNAQVCFTGRMQLRRSPLDQSLPKCVFDHPETEQCLHRHGSYDRCDGASGNVTIMVLRFLCKFTGRTISLLPDRLLPYRAVHVSEVQADFDRRCVLPSKPAQTEQDAILKGCLRRAWHRFRTSERQQALTTFYGQRIPLSNSPQALWQAIRQTSDSLEGRLLDLAREGKSLLGDYRCLRA